MLRTDLGLQNYAGYISKTITHGVDSEQCKIMGSHIMTRCVWIPCGTLKARAIGIRTCSSGFSSSSFACVVNNPACAYAKSKLWVASVPTPGIRLANGLF